MQANLLGGPTRGPVRSAIRRGKAVGDWPPQKTAITAPTASDGAKGMRVFRPDDDTTIMTTPKTIPTMKPARKAT